MGLLWTMRVNNTTILIFIIDYKWWIWYPLIAVNINSDESCFLLDNHLAICYIAMDDGLLVRHFTCWFYPRIFLTWLTFFYRNRPTFLFRDWNHHVLASPPYQQWVHFVFLTPFDVFPVGFPIFFLVYDEGITRIYPSVDSIIWCGSQAERRDLRLRSRARDLGSKDGAGELGVGGWVTDGAVWDMNVT